MLEIWHSPYIDPMWASIAIDDKTNVSCRFETVPGNIYLLDFLVSSSIPGTWKIMINNTETQVIHTGESWENHLLPAFTADQYGTTWAWLSWKAQNPPPPDSILTQLYSVTINQIN